MRLLVIGKSPPIEGGAGHLTHQTCASLVDAGHSVDLVTDAYEVEPTMRCHLISNYHEMNPSRLRIISPEKLGSFRQYPQSSFRTERLLGCALQLSKEYSYDLILGWYIIPYGFVASIVSSKAGVPHALIHGGSDLLTLSRHKHVGVIIQDTIERAHCIVTANNKNTKKRVSMLGGKNNNLLYMPRGFPLPRYHRNTSYNPNQLFFCENIIEDLCKEIASNFKSTNINIEPFLLSAKRLLAKNNVTTFLMYGKSSKGKNTLNILQRFSDLKKRGLKFRLICIVCGRENDVVAILNFWRATKHIQNDILLLPAINPMLIPSIFSRVDIGICGEMGFGVKNHLSVVPREIMSAGLGLIASRELAKGAFYRWILRNKINAALFKDMEEFDKIVEQIIENKNYMKSLKVGALKTTRILEEELSASNPIVNLIGKIHQVATERFIVSR